MLLEVVCLGALASITGYAMGVRKRSLEAAATKLPANVYPFATSTVLAHVEGEPDTASRKLGVVCPRCDGRYVAGDLKSCECEECPWPHFHWECRRCSYNFFILGKDVVAP